MKTLRILLLLFLGIGLGIGVAPFLPGMKAHWDGIVAKMQSRKERRAEAADLAPAKPSSRLRISYKSRTSWVSMALTNTPACFREITSPELSNSRKASRTGTRDTFKRLATSGSLMRSPGAS